jgi:4-hydroxy-tetrahydrodipicolinate reductase
MGREVEAIAVQRGHQIVARFDIHQPPTTQNLPPTTDVLIDFSTADAVLDHARLAADVGVPLVEGTTGWEDRRKDVCAIPGLTMIYSPNFSIGVYHFAKLAEEAARRFGKIAGYDAFIHEVHHAGKVDAPSGTALALARRMLPFLPQKKRILPGNPDGKIPGDALHVSSSRVGTVFGRHIVGFDSPYDIVEIRHEAKSRQGFAFGAVLAAEWIVSRNGIFTMDEFVADLLK